MDFMDSDASNSRPFNEDSSSNPYAMYGGGEDSNSLSMTGKFQVQAGDEQQFNENGVKRKIEDGGGSGEVNGVGGAGEGEGGDEEGPTPNKKPHVEGIEIRHLLPELEKFWGAVDQDPNDFTAWTQLLQYVDSENEVVAARDAYDKFLGKYPYCYGYWKKYSDYEKKKGSPEECEKVFRRGLKAISLSVDLWIHYLNHVKANNEDQPDIIRSQFEEAIEACGMEFRSDKLWEHYMQWERENNNFANVMKIYDRLLATPTQNYQTHLQNVKELVNQQKPQEIISAEEYTELKAQALQSTGEGETLDDEGVDNKIREIVIERRTEIYKKNETEITARWTYEEAIKRPYFHVKPLEKGQLRMWKEYLEFEINKGNFQRIIILFERCLIACALYEEYWIKYVRYLMSRNEAEEGALIPQIEDVFNRACNIHHPNKPWINLYYASFEEGRGNVDEASKMLERLEDLTPDSLVICYRRINVERRRGNLAKCVELFQQYIEQLKLKSPVHSVHLSIKYAKFTYKMLQDYEQAKQILQSAADVHESTNAKCIMALIELGLEQSPVDMNLILSTFDAALASEMPEEQKVTFAHRKIEFLEDYGTDVESVNKAQDELQRLAKIMREKKTTTPTPAAIAANGDKSEEGQSADASKAAVAEPTANGTAAYDQYAYSQQYDQYGQYANWNYQASSGYGYGQEGWSAYQGYYGGDATTGTT